MPTSSELCQMVMIAGSFWFIVTLIFLLLKEKKVCQSCYNRHLEYGLKKLSDGWAEHKDTPDEILEYVLEVLEHIKHDMNGDTNSILRVKVMHGIELIKNNSKTGGK